MPFDLNSSPEFREIYNAISQHRRLVSARVSEVIRRIESQKMPLELLPFKLDVGSIPHLQDMSLLVAKSFKTQEQCYFLIMPIPISKNSLNSLKIAILIEPTASSFRLRFDMPYKVKIISFDPTSDARCANENDIEPDLNATSKLYPEDNLFEFSRPLNGNEKVETINSENSILHFIVLPYFHAITLAEFSTTQPLSHDGLIILYLQLTFAVLCIHLQFMIIKDIKPENFLIDINQDNFHEIQCRKIRVIDVEQAQHIHTQPTRRSTGSSHFNVTPFGGREDSAAITDKHLLAKLQTDFGEEPVKEEYRLLMETTTPFPIAKELLINAIKKVDFPTQVISYLHAPECQLDLYALGLLFLFLALGEARYRTLIDDTFIARMKKASTVAQAQAIIQKKWPIIKGHISQSMERSLISIIEKLLLTPENYGIHNLFNDLIILATEKLPPYTVESHLIDLLKVAPEDRQKFSDPKNIYGYFNCLFNPIEPARTPHAPINISLQKHCTIL